MEKINISRLLKNCSKGTKLYSPMFGDVFFEKVINNMIFIKTEKEYVFSFDEYGRYKEYINAECLLFPSKENRDWSTFQMPFNDGDVITCDNECCTFISIFKEYASGRKSFRGHCVLIVDDNELKVKDSVSYFNEARFATAIEKRTLFQSINDNGYYWNDETKTLEKLIEPKFKVGDKINPINGDFILTIVKILNQKYIVRDISGKFGMLCFGAQDKYELYHNPNRFDVTTLKPFKTEVLVRTENSDIWEGDLYVRYDKNATVNKFHCIGGWFEKCIPYEGNEHLLGTTNDCSDFFITWND